MFVENIFCNKENNEMSLIDKKNEIEKENMEFEGIVIRRLGYFKMTKTILRNLLPTRSPFEGRIEAACLQMG